MHLSQLKSLNLVVFPAFTIYSCLLENLLALSRLKIEDENRKGVKTTISIILILFYSSLSSPPQVGGTHRRVAAA